MIFNLLTTFDFVGRLRAGCQARAASWSIIFRKPVSTHRIEARGRAFGIML
jgi:hypothetical protein